MDEYIKREALLAKLKPDEPGDDRAAVLLCDVKRILREFAMMVPAEDVAPVVHGEWVNKEVDYLRYHVYGNCSICHERKRIDRYCPNCGARMDGED